MLSHDPRFETRFGRPSFSTTGPKWLVYIAVLTNDPKFETRFGQSSSSAKDQNNSCT